MMPLPASKGDPPAGTDIGCAHLLPIAVRVATVNPASIDNVLFTEAGGLHKEGDTHQLVILLTAYSPSGKPRASCAVAWLGKRLLPVCTNTSATT